MPRLIISSGHTSKKPGSSANGLREVDLTKSIARQIVPYLRSSGIITLSVPPNLDLDNRIDWVNKTGFRRDFKDIAIEIHINEGGKEGFEFWHKEGDQDSKELASTIMNLATSETGEPSQGVKSEKEHDFGSLAFVSKTNTISVLLECLYIDNEDNAKKLKNPKELDKVAKGIAKGILKFLNVPFKEPKSAQKPKDNQQPQQKQNNTPKHPPVNNPKPNNTFTPPKPITPPSMPGGGAPGGFGNNSFGGGGFGGGNIPKPPGFGGAPGSGFGNNPNTAGGGDQMSRDDRKDMINKMYKKVLGREPNQNDLNYFLNIAITEDKLIKRMIDSQEHLDMVKEKEEFGKMKKEHKEQKIELERLKAENTDNQAMLKNLTQLLHQKNSLISKMRGYIDNVQQKQKKTSNSSGPTGPKYKPRFMDRFFHFFSGILG